MSKQRLFRFKKFTVDHSRATMKVGTDGVLLGAWVRMNNARSILDIGTGSGVIALMLAQRSENGAHIDAVELEETDADQARQNVQNSPWPEKVKVHVSPIQDYQCANRYDLIVSNPPFFINSYEPPDARRLQARHHETLSFQDLINAVLRLLHDKGTLNVILPPVEGKIFTGIANAHHLHTTRKCLFRTREGKPAERMLLEFSFQKLELEEAEILLYSSGDEWSPTYRALTRDFYLKA